jgi:hypothetical protein
MPAAAEDTAKPGGAPAARRAAVHRAATWLHLAAAPTFLLMALATLLDASPMAAMCSGGGDGWLLGGMAPMYLLMSAFHLGPWLEMASGGRGKAPALRGARFRRIVGFLRRHPS